MILVLDDGLMTRENENKHVFIVITQEISIDKLALKIKIKIVAI